MMITPRSCPFLAPLTVCLAVSILTHPSTASEPEILFDGATLDGWMVKCRPKDRDKDYWTVQDGALTARVPVESDHHYIWLLTEKEYGDFDLTLRVQTIAGTRANSGIQVRSRYDDQVGWLDGPQVDIHPPAPWRSGFIYDETRGVKQWLCPIQGPPSMAREEHAPAGWTWRHTEDGQDIWNDVTIRCRGTRLTTVINGTTVCDYDGAGTLDDDNHRRRRVGLRGHIGLQIHPGGGLFIRFKDIHLLPKPTA